MKAEDRSGSGDFGLHQRPSALQLCGLRVAARRWRRTEAAEEGEELKAKREKFAKGGLVVFVIGAKMWWW